MVSIPLLSGCNQLNIGKKHIDVEIGEPNSSGMIPITLTGDKSTYLLLLSNQKGNTVGSAVISEMEMADGIQSTQISLGDGFYSTGVKRNFTLIILDDPDLDGSGNEVYRTTLSYYGANISIVNCSKPRFVWNDIFDTYDFKDIYVKIKNSGDLADPYVGYYDADIVFEDNGNSDTYFVAMFAINNVDFVAGEIIPPPEYSGVGGYKGRTDNYLTANTSKIYYCIYDGVTHALNYRYTAGKINMTIIFHNHPAKFSTTIEIP